MNIIVLHYTDIQFILHKWRGTYVCGEFEGTVSEIAEQLDERFGIPVYFCNGQRVLAHKEVL